MGKHLLYKTISDHSKPFLHISMNLAKFPLFIGTAAILRRCSFIRLVIPLGLEQNRWRYSVYMGFCHFAILFGETLAIFFDGRIE